MEGKGTWHRYWQGDAFGSGKTKKKVFFYFSSEIRSKVITDSEEREGRLKRTEKRNSYLAEQGSEHAR